MRIKTECPNCLHQSNFVGGIDNLYIVKDLKAYLYQCGLCKSYNLAFKGENEYISMPVEDYNGLIEKAPATTICKQ